MFNILFEASPIDPATGVATTFRFASAHALSSGTIPDGKSWEPAIVGGPETSVSVFAAGRVIPVSVDHGSITIQITDPALARMTWDGALGRVWVGDGESAFSTYRQIFSGSLGAQSRDGQNLKVPLYGAGFEINETPILTGTYAGTGGVEGPSTLKGKRKPKAFGYCRYVTPVRINQAYVVYQVHDGAAQDIPAVYEAGVTLATPVATVATYAELIALTLKPGEWAKAPAVGMFRLGSEPSGKLTADVRGDASGGYASTLATIAAKLLRGAGVLASDIDTASLASVANLSWCAFVTDETTVGAVIANAFAAAGAYAFPDELGVWRAGSWLNDGATITANATDGEFVIVPGSFKQEEASPPNYLVRINGDRCWSPHSSTEISPAIVELKEGAKDALERARAAKAAADQAAADNVVQKARIDAIADDNILDTSEKGQVKLQFAVITANKPRIVSDAAGFNISSAAYEAAYAALASYLTGLSPSWSDTTVDTPIVRATFVDRFQAEAVARQNLLSAIEFETAKLANWSGVTGDGKPEDGATVGAPNGTEVGGRPVETVIKDIDRANDTIAGIHKQLPNLVLPLLQKPIDELSALNIRYGASQLKATTALHRESLVAIRKLTTRVDEDGAKVAEDYLQLTSRVTDAEKAIKGIDVSGPIEAGLAEIRKTIANANYATSEAIDLKIANYGKNVSAWQAEEERVRSEKDSALAEDIEALGVSIRKDVGDSYTTLEGAFNDLRKLVVDSDGNDALALRIDEMGVRITTEVGGEKTARESAIRTVEKAIIDGDKVSADRLDTLSSSVDGVVGPQGEIVKINGIVQTLQKTQADDNGARATETKNLQSRLDNVNGASLEQTLTTFANKVDGVGASYVLKVQTDQNGQRYIAGMGVAIENGVSAIAFSADSFRLTTTGIAPQQVFYADATGIYAPNLTVEKLKANSIDSVSLKQAASSKTSYSIVEDDVACGRGVTTTVVSYQFYKEDDDSLLKVQMFAQCYNQDDLDFFGDIVLDGSSRQRAQVRMPFDNSNSRGQAPITPFAFLPNIPKGNHTIAFTLFSNETEGPTYVRAGSTLEVTELRRASIGSSTGSAPPVSGGSSGGGGSGGGSGDGGYGGGGTYQPELSQT